VKACHHFRHGVDLPAFITPEEISSRLTGVAGLVSLIDSGCFEGMQTALVRRQYDYVVRVDQIRSLETADNQYPQAVRPIIDFDLTCGSLVITSQSFLLTTNRPAASGERIGATMLARFYPDESVRGRARAKSKNRSRLLCARSLNCFARRRSDSARQASLKSRSKSNDPFSTIVLRLTSVNVTSVSE
jgi:hypothetical protein